MDVLFQVGLSSDSGVFQQLVLSVNTLLCLSNCLLFE